MNINVSVVGLRGARFGSLAAIETFRTDADLYERVVRAYEIDGDDLALWEGLAALGFDAREIRAHTSRPGIRLPQGYVSAGDF